MHVGLRNFSQWRDQSEHGQALVLGLMLIGIVILTWSSSYYIGHLVHDKMSLIRATDAAVMSAATTQARILNFHAYLNRAQLANQLAMMHLVTLASQERFRATQALQSMRMNPPAFLIGMFFGSSFAASYLAAQAGGVSDSQSIRALEKAFHQHDNVIIEMLEQTRLSLLRDLSISRNQILERVLIRNLGDSGSIMSGNTLSELGVSYEIKRDEITNKLSYLSIQSPVWRSVFKQVMEPYGYLKPRNEVRQNIWAVNVRCPHKRHELRRRGQSSASADGIYESDDTISFHAVRSNRAIGCYQREYPMGWAQVKADVRASELVNAPKYWDRVTTSVTAGQSFSSEPFWHWVKKQGNSRWDIFNGSANQLAQSWSAPQKISWQSRTKAGFVDVEPSRAEFRFDIDTIQKSKFLSQHMKENFLSGRFKMLGLDLKDSISASASSVTYFSRPGPRDDGLHEHPSLFHPYWHARLVSR